MCFCDFILRVCIKNWPSKQALSNHKEVPCKNQTITLRMCVWVCDHVSVLQWTCMGSVKCNKATVTEADRVARETSSESVLVCLTAVMVVVCVSICVGGVRKWSCKVVCLYSVTDPNFYTCSQGCWKVKNERFLFLVPDCSDFMHHTVFHQNIKSLAKLFPQPHKPHNFNMVSWKIRNETQT